MFQTSNNIPALTRQKPQTTEGREVIEGFEELFKVKKTYRILTPTHNVFPYIFTISYRVNEILATSCEH